MANYDFETARKNMVDYQIRCCKVLDPTLLDTLLTMPRETFLPEAVRNLGYMEGHVPLPENQEMLSPLQEATILQALKLRGNERILEIGSGTGYLTALLAMHSAEVVALELHESLVHLANKNLADHGVTNATVLQKDANDLRAVEGLGSFDMIIIGAAVKAVPAHVSARLQDHGRMIAFIGTNPVVTLTVLDRMGSTWRSTGLMETLLLDMEAMPEAREFVF
ncbi:MAG: methyltransferase domain-containing protein [Mariprofundaceae bacterium]